MSTSNPNPNRNKLLLGFTAVVAVLIVAFFMWPANVQKDDASGSIGAVQKHHAPQITQADVILGGESVKHQQKVLSTDFLADAAKLRAISAHRDTAAERALANELQMRYMRAAEEAIAAARTAGAREADVVQLDSVLKNAANDRVLSNEEMQAFNNQLGLIVVICSRDKAFGRLTGAEQALEHMSANEEVAVRQVADLDQAMSRVKATESLADESQYLSMMEMESRTLARGQANEYALAAEQLEARAKQNAIEVANNEEQMAMRYGRIVADIQSVESRTTQARVTGNSELAVRLGALAGRLQSEEAASRTLARDLQSLDARSK